MPTSFSAKAQDFIDAYNPRSIFERLFEKDVPVFFNPMAEHRAADEWVAEVAAQKELLNKDTKELLRKVSSIETPSQISQEYWQEFGPILGQKTDTTLPLNDTIHLLKERQYVERLRRAFKAKATYNAGIDPKLVLMPTAGAAVGAVGGALVGLPFAGAAIGGLAGAGASIPTMKSTPAKDMEQAEHNRYSSLDDNDLRLMLRGMSVEKTLPNGKVHTFAIKA